MKKVLCHFARSEDGNAVIDWVVLMAGMVLLAISVVITITANVDDITDTTMDRVETMKDFSPS
jgi:Flp pilus assembly pilin Flp